MLPNMPHSKKQANNGTKRDTRRNICGHHSMCRLSLCNGSLVAGGTFVPWFEPEKPQQERTSPFTPSGCQKKQSTAHCDTRLASYFGRSLVLNLKP
eukprot:3440872-Amphidinium_carterae.1